MRTSPYSNYRAAKRANTNASFVYKLGIVEEEADESIEWLELLEKTEKVKAEDVKVMKKPANEIVAMSVAAIKTVKKDK